MRRITKVLLFFIGIFLFADVVSAAGYNLTVIRQGKKTTVFSSNMERVSQDLFNGEIVYSTAGITLNKTANKIDRIYLTQDNDPNANITITVKGDNHLNILYIDGLRATVSLYDDKATFTFNPGKMVNGSNVVAITNGAEQSAFFSNYIYFKYDHKFNSDGSIKLYREVETTTTKQTTRVTNVTRTAEVLREDTNIAYNSDKSISIESKNGDDFKAETGLYGKEETIPDNQLKKINDKLSKMDLPEMIKVYDITMLERGKPLNVSGNYIIRIRVEDRLSYFEDFKVIYLDDDYDILEIIRAEVEDNYIKFNTTHLSKYGIIGTYKSATAVVRKENTKESTIQSIFLILALLCALAVVIFSTYKKLKGSSASKQETEDDVVFEVMDEEEGNHTSYVPEVEDVNKKKTKKKSGPVIGEEPVIAYAVPVPEESIVPGAISQKDIAALEEESSKGKKKKRKEKKVKGKVQPEPVIIAAPVEEEAPIDNASIPEVEEVKEPPKPVVAAPVPAKPVARPVQKPVVKEEPVIATPVKDDKFAEEPVIPEPPKPVVKEEPVIPEPPKVEPKLEPKEEPKEEVKPEPKEEKVEEPKEEVKEEKKTREKKEEIKKEEPKEAPKEEVKSESKEEKEEPKEEKKEEKPKKGRKAKVQPPISFD